MAEKIFVLQINLSGEAFKGDALAEIAEVLVSAEGIVRQGYEKGELRDVNGKTCGGYEIVEEWALRTLGRGRAR